MGGDFVSSFREVLDETPWTMEKYRRFFNTCIIC